MKKNSVAATGLTGLIGSRLAELISEDFEWLPLRYEDGFDITSGEKVDRAIGSFGGEAILHLAAFTDLNAANKERGDKTGMCYKINVEGTRNIARVCQKYGKYLIHVSTDAVFGGDKEFPYTEEDLPSPIEWYGQTKLWAEEEVKTSGARAVIVRFAYPFRTEFAAKKDFVRKIIDQLKSGEKLTMFSDTVFTPTFIDDIAPALEAILAKKPKEIFHVVGSTILSPFQAAMEIAEIFGFNQNSVKPIKLSEYLVTSSRPYPRWAGLSNKKVKNDLGISMSSFKQALEDIKAQAGKELNTHLGSF